MQGKGGEREKKGDAIPYTCWKAKRRMQLAESRTSNLFRTTLERKGKKKREGEKSSSPLRAGKLEQSTVGNACGTFFALSSKMEEQERRGGGGKKHVLGHKPGREWIAQMENLPDRLVSKTP